MNILLLNPPNSGRSIPEERYGLDSLRQIFRGEPLALEALAGNLDDQTVRILDLKADPEGLERELASFSPDLVGITGVTCEANTVLRLARTVKEHSDPVVVVGGIHASNDPAFFNRPEIDFIAVGLAKATFRELITALDNGRSAGHIAGLAETNPGQPLSYRPREFGSADLVSEAPPAYHLVADYRSRYTLSSLKLQLGFVGTAMGCPFNCAFCCIAGLTGGRYLTQPAEAVVRDIELLGDIPVIRLIDANTFGDPRHAAQLCASIKAAGLQKQFIVDVRSDTVVRHPELLEEWRKIGLKAVIIGFEEISDERLRQFDKANRAATNREAIAILHDLGISIVGDFIISPDYDERQFESLARYIKENAIDLPMITVLTPLPGTRLFEAMKDDIVLHDLDYYTLTNAVVPTRLPEETFYRLYAELMKEGHAGARL